MTSCCQYEVEMSQTLGTNNMISGVHLTPVL